MVFTMRSLSHFHTCTHDNCEANAIGRCTTCSEVHYYCCKHAEEHRHSLDDFEVV